MSWLAKSYTHVLDRWGDVATDAADVGTTVGGGPTPGSEGWDMAWVAWARRIGIIP